MPENGFGSKHQLNGNYEKKADPKDRLKELVFGAPRDLEDKSIFHKISLVAILAWIGLGADGLSSSSYGPDEAFRTLGEHTYLAVALALAVGLTVFIIAAAYSRIIEEFPHGGGGYVVATKLLGERFGVVSGSALLVDYVMTIAVSIASACDATFSFLPLAWQPFKLPVAMVIIVLLMVLNIRGVKESVLALTPIFVIFLATHVPLILGAVLWRIPELPATASHVASGFRSGYASLGLGGLMLLFLHAYSFGAGTYTGLEAVSNGLPIIREPRVQNGRRTMLYMALSLAFMASGLLVCYLLFGSSPQPGKTMNAVFLEQITARWPMGRALVIVTLLSEGGLLFVAAQAGFIDGPRVLANMALDSWVPRSFSALSERLTQRNGVVLMTVASLAALVYTRGDVRQLVIMYSINVFVTFSLSMFGMAKMWFSRRRETKSGRRLTLFVIGFLLCITILVIAVIEKFAEGGWLTVAVTSALVILCFLIRRHYRYVGAQLTKLFQELEDIPAEHEGPVADPDPQKPTAAVLVAGYGGIGIHTVLNIFRTFPGYYKNLVFISVGVVDSGGFKGKDSVAELKKRTEESVQKYIQMSHNLGVPATFRMAIGTDAVVEAEKLCMDVAKEFPRVTFFAGKIIFREEKWFERLLHNETAFAIQKRLQLEGRVMVIIPAKV